MMKINSIKDIADILKEGGNNLLPVEAAKITQLEMFYKVSLPGVYKQFLKLMGNGAGVYMQGSSVFFDEIYSLKQWAEELISDNNFRSLPQHAFVFWMHQGYQLAYFNIGEGEDPPVYYFSEGKGGNDFELIEKTLTEFFISQLSFNFPLT